jgi:hypothetical protein
LVAAAVFTERNGEGLEVRSQRSECKKALRCEKSFESQYEKAEGLEVLATRTAKAK